MTYLNKLYSQEMNYFKNFTKFALVATVITLSMAACNQQENSNNAKDNKNSAKVEPAKAGQHLEIRYIDEDSVLKNYNLAKDFEEMTTRLQNEFDQAQKKYADQLGNFQNSVNQKMQNNQYASENAYKADVQKYQQMEQNAQNEMAKLQQNSANQMQQSQKQLNDSIHNFLNDYAKKNNYDMILFKSATGYINPSLEVTDEVIEGLNKRYTKVAKK